MKEDKRNEARQHPEDAVFESLKSTVARKNVELLALLREHPEARSKKSMQQTVDVAAKVQEAFETFGIESNEFKAALRSYEQQLDDELRIVRMHIQEAAVHKEKEQEASRQEIERATQEYEDIVTTMQRDGAWFQVNLASIDHVPKLLGPFGAIAQLPNPQAAVDSEADRFINFLRHFDGPEHIQTVLPSREDGSPIQGQVQVYATREVHTLPGHDSQVHHEDVVSFASTPLSYDLSSATWRGQTNSKEFNEHITELIQDGWFELDGDLYEMISTQKKCPPYHGTYLSIIQVGDGTYLSIIQVGDGTYLSIIQVGESKHNTAPYHFAKITQEQPSIDVSTYPKGEMPQVYFIEKNLSSLENGNDQVVHILHEATPKGDGTYHIDAYEDAPDSLATDEAFFANEWAGISPELYRAITQPGGRARIHGRFVTIAEVRDPHTGTQQNYAYIANIPNVSAMPDTPDGYTTTRRIFVAPGRYDGQTISREYEEITLDAESNLVLIDGSREQSAQLNVEKEMNDFGWFRVDQKTFERWSDGGVFPFDATTVGLAMVAPEHYPNSQQYFFTLNPSEHPELPHNVFAHVARCSLNSTKNLLLDGEHATGFKMIPASEGHDLGMVHHTSAEQSMRKTQEYRTPPMVRPMQKIEGEAPEEEPPSAGITTPETPQPPRQKTAATRNLRRTLLIGLIAGVTAVGSWLGLQKRRPEIDQPQVAPEATRAIDAPADTGTAQKLLDEATREKETAMREEEPIDQTDRVDPMLKKAPTVELLPKSMEVEQTRQIVTKTAQEAGPEHAELLTLDLRLTVAPHNGIIQTVRKGMRDLGLSGAEINRQLHELYGKHKEQWDAATVHPGSIIDLEYQRNAEDITIVRVLINPGGKEERLAEAFPELEPPKDGLAHIDEVFTITRTAKDGDSLSHNFTVGSYMQYKSADGKQKMVRIVGPSKDASGGVIVRDERGTQFAVKALERFTPNPNVRDVRGYPGVDVTPLEHHQFELKLTGGKGFIHAAETFLTDHLHLDVPTAKLVVRIMNARIQSSGVIDSEGNTLRVLPDSVGRGTTITLQLTGSAKRPRIEALGIDIVDLK